MMMMISMISMISTSIERRARRNSDARARPHRRTRLERDAREQGRRGAGAHATRRDVTRDRANE